MERRLYDSTFLPTFLHPESSKVSVFCGPVFDDADLVDESNGIKIPRRFWMIGYFENKQNPSAPLVAAYVAAQYKNDNGTIVPLPLNEDSSVEISVPELEGLTGLRFSQH
jgi:DNA/RNA endonuclease G (NUC1)